MKDDPISHHVLGVALTPLIPLPFVDGWLQRRFLKATYKRIAESMGKELSDETLKVLTESRSNMLWGCFVSIIWWPIRKLVRTVVYVLTLKECVDVMAEAAMRTEMVRAALSQGLLPEHADAVRTAMEEVTKAHAGSPVTRFIRRKEAPEISLHRDDAVARSVAQVTAYGGGGKVLAAFEEELERIRSGGGPRALSDREREEEQLAREEASAALEAEKEAVGIGVAQRALEVAQAAGAGAVTLSGDVASDAADAVAAAVEGAAGGVAGAVESVLVPRLEE